MTIDERLDKITTGLELVKTDLEILKQVAESHESDLHRIFSGIHELRDMQAKNEQLMANMMLGINEIGRAVLHHEKRISDLEGGRA